MIKPTIGRRVWYWPSNYDVGRELPLPGVVMSQHQAAQPFDAGIAYVHGDRMVNLTVADHNGILHARTEVFLAQDDDEVPPGCAYAQWMPYQQGQAKPAPMVARGAVQLELDLKAGEQ